MFNHIFSSLRIGQLELPNRLIVPAMVMNYCDRDGNATARYTAYHEAKARGGWGLVITENYAVDRGGKGFPNIPGLWEDAQIKSHRAFTRRIHASGGRIFAQIYHAGRQTTHQVTGSQPVAPSPIPCPAMKEIPRELTVEDIQELVEKFGDCARRARDAGFDGIEIHGAHGYLIAQFMSPYANQRTDAYGGNRDQRMRFPLDIIANIQRKAGADFPVSFRISGDELVPGGRTLAETKSLAVTLEAAGVHALHVSAGVYESAYAIVPPAAVSHGWITGYAGEVKQVVQLPVITVGRINDPRMAEAVLAEGKADLVAMGRASLADPDLPRKAAAGQWDDINRCIGCLQGCNARIARNEPATCLVNPTLGQEGVLNRQPAPVRKKVFVAGAGPAGMEAALTAARRGHEVHVFEKSDHVGGQFHTAAIPPDKAEIAGFIAWQQKQLLDLGVTLHLQEALTSETIQKENVRCVVVATGSHPLVPALAGSSGEHVVTAADVLEGKARTGQKVAIIGGGMVGAETANHLAHQGKSVTIVEMLPRVAADVVPAVRHFLLKQLKEKQVRIYVNAVVKEIFAIGLVIEASGKAERLGSFDTIVLAAGVTGCHALTAELAGRVPELITIGDAAKIGNALDAIADGHQAGFQI